MIVKKIIGHCREHLNSLGNWCGHKPAEPRFYEPPEQHGIRPDVILLAQESLQKFYWNPKEYLISLHAYHGSDRQERSEARESDATVISILLHHLELATMKVGTPLPDASLKSLSIKDIALRAGWRKPEDNNDPAHKDRGIKRTWRSLKRLEKAGYITIHPRCERIFNHLCFKEKEYKGLPAIRCVKPKLFHELKVNIERLNRRRKQAGVRLKKMYRNRLNELQEKAKHDLQAAIQGILQFNNNLNGKTYINNSLKRGQAALAQLETQLRAQGYFDTS